MNKFEYYDRYCYDNNIEPKDYGGNRKIHIKKFIEDEDFDFHRPDVMLDSNGKFWYYEDIREWICNKKNCDLEVTKDTIDDTVFQLCFKDVTEEWIQKEIERRIAIDE